MARRTATPRKPDLMFYQKLTLNSWLWHQFGVDNLANLAPEMKKPLHEEIDDEGVTGFLKQWKLSYPEARRPIKDDALSRYDLNIVTHLRVINDRREEKIRLKYFQWLSLLFVEYYLDSYFNERDRLLTGLNAWRENFTLQASENYANADVPAYVASDLNKIALWNATGSGKTLLLHINYLQYLHYAQLENGSSFILLTPKEGLSLQHLDDFAVSGIDAKIYDKSESRTGTNRNRIIVLENTKLASKDGDKTVSVRRFGSQNVLFVDEGHRGSSGDTWQGYRDDLCKEGFSFEYSATFGQAAEASGDKDLLNRYAKCILFDYSYKFFYKDGYGKDYKILNLKEEGDATQRQTYLTACLLSFYQQKKLYAAKAAELEPFNIENPLFVFVGASVNAVRKERGQEVSDVLDILLFFKQFLENRAVAVGTITSLLAGISGLLDNRDHDIFAGAFPYLTETALTAEQIYADMLQTVFNSASATATLHIENLKGVSGEIQLRLGDNPPFGIINVGDDAKLLKLCGNNGFDTASISFSGSLFQNVTKPDSSINLLIGAKKFTEGWNCWRVSTMGLMNVGRSEGSEIIQLFGRGVRLKGHNMSLKRSKAWQLDSGETNVPRHITLLETLYVFGVRADYMKQFKEFLEREGVPSDNRPVTIVLPVIKNLPPIRRLKTLRVKGGADFKKDASKPVLAYDTASGKVILDCYAKVQFQSSGVASTAAAATKNAGTLPQDAIRLLDVDALWMELVRYKKQKGRINLTVPKSAVVDLLAHSDWYTLLIPPAELECTTYADVKRIGKIVMSLLEKYLDRFYYVQQNNWESQTVGYELVELTDESFPAEYEVTTTDGEFEIWLRQIATELQEHKRNNTLPQEKVKAPLTIFGVSAHLYNPLIYNATGGVAIDIAPVAINDSEKKFVVDLAAFVQANAAEYPEVYLLRNQSKKGVGFFDNKGFYPDFILWTVSGDRQSIAFVDPHGMRNETKGLESPKVRLATDIRTKVTDANCALHSVILSPTRFAEIANGGKTKDEWKAANVLFMEDAGYIRELLGKVKITEATD